MDLGTAGGADRRTVLVDLLADALVGALLVCPDRGPVPGDAVGAGSGRPVGAASRKATQSPQAVSPRSSSLPLP